MSEPDQGNTRKEIAVRIKELRTKTGHSKSFVAEKLGISETSYSQLENSEALINHENILKLSSLFGVTTDFLLKGDKKSVHISPETGFIPFIKIQARAGFIENYDKNFSFDEYDWFRIPGFNPSVDQLLFEVEGESMVPTLFPRDILICQVLSKKESPKSGDLVLVVTQNEIHVKRFRSCEESGMIILEADNPNEKIRELKVKKSEIKDIMMVRGKVSGYVVPQIHTVSKGKLKALEEDIELLKEQVPTLNIREREREREREVRGEEGNIPGKPILRKFG